MLFRSAAATGWQACRASPHKSLRAARRSRTWTALWGTWPNCDAPWPTSCVDGHQTPQNDTIYTTVGVFFLVPGIDTIVEQTVHERPLVLLCSVHVTEMLLCCSVFASLDQKSPVASSHFHSSISSISSTKESHNHSSKVRFKPASIFF